MSNEELKMRLIKDLELVGLPINEVDLQIRPYSKSYFGNYFPVCDDRKVAKIYLYPYISKMNRIMYPYSELLLTTIHEMCHHIQFSSSEFVRKHGVMHDENFWKLYNTYKSRINKKGALN